MGRLFACVAFYAAAFVAALCVFLSLRAFLRALRFVFAGRLRKEKGEPRGENDHGSFPLVLSGQRRWVGRTHDPRFPSGEAKLQSKSNQ